MSNKKLSFKKAAIKILERSDKPMTASEITKIALAENLIDSTGETPDATMAAQIYVDIKGKNSPFRKVGRGLFTLRTKSDVPNSPLLIIENQNELVKKQLKELLHSMDPFQFEYLVSDLLQKIGYENVTVTKRSGDKGIDVIANLTVGGITNVKTVIQAKRYAVANKISGAVITQLRGSAEVDQRGLVITTSDFTKDGIEESNAPNKMPVSLVNGERLIELLIKYGVGVKKEELTVLSIDEPYFQNYSSEETNTIDSEKSRSLWPLPGGINSYIDTLNEFLKEIHNGNNTKKGLIKWYLNNFENVNSEATAQGYINVPKNMGLTYVDKGIYKFTEAGGNYYDSQNKELLYEIISKNILAFDDIYEYLKSSSIPVNEEEILGYLKDNFAIEWTTFAQVNFRLIWLINLAKIIKTNKGYIVWDNIEYLGSSYFDNNFKKLAPALLTFLINSLLCEENIEIGYFSKGAIVSYDIYNTDKRLELKLKSDMNFTLEFSFYDDFEEEEEKNCIYELTGDDVKMIPIKLINIMKDAMRKQESATIKPQIIKNKS